MKQYLDFFDKYDFLFRDAVPENQVALLWSEDSFAFNPAESVEAMGILQQNLLSRGVPYRLVYDEEFLVAPFDYKVLFVANALCLSEELCQRICDFVDQGGYAIITGHSGQYDQNFREYIKPGLESILNHKNVHYELQATEQKGTTTALVVPSLGTKFKYTDSIHDALKKGLGGHFEVETNAPFGVVVEKMQIPDRAIILHMINYDSKSTSPIDVNMEFKKTVEQVRLFSPDSDPQELDVSFKQEKDRLVFAVPALQTYSIVMISPQIISS
jgi:hypothetical protein